MIMKPSVTSTGAGLGAVLTGIDLSAFSETDFTFVHQAWLDHQVVLLRGQSLSPDSLIGFSRRLGDLDHAPIQESGRRFVAGYPELYVVSNVIENGQPIGSLGAGEAVWHTDMSYLPAPPKASMLYALEIPPEGGNTSFCNMYAAADALPAAVRTAITGKLVKHDGTYNSGGYVRAGVTPTDDPRLAPGALHPILVRHPETHRIALYLGRRRNAYIDGLPLDESEALLDEIWATIDDPAISWTHIWQVGDAVLWDNRCTMHRRDPFDASARRVMHRTQVKGEAPPEAA
jgi:taurine dioxygenase